MTCPKCQATIDPVYKQCPECGTGLYRNVSGVIRTSAVLISADGEESFYHSVQEVPERLRKQLIESTAGDNSGTIVIADRAGKEQLTQALARRESARPAETRPLTDLSLSGLPMSDLQNARESLLEPAIEITPRRQIARLPWVAWAGFFAVLASAIAISIFFGTRW